MIWKSVTGYEDIYEVSETGLIKRVSAGRGTFAGYIFTPNEDKKGYLRTRLTDAKGKASTIKVHRVVCAAFNENPNNLPQVNHKDGDKKNNHYTNLEWCDGLHNMKHAAVLGLIPKYYLNKFGADHNRSIPIKGTNVDTGEERIFHGANEAAREIGSNIGSIWRVRKGIYKHTKRWAFEPL